jgi:glucose-6-phosphate-specific signal transduction histidine kinase
MTWPHSRPARYLSVWRDLLVAAAFAAVCALLAAHFNLQEALFAYTRRWEPLQLDELPVAIFVFSACLVGLYARRLLQLRRALAENRRLAQHAVDAQETERKHLARELHDELGQYLNAIKLDARAMNEVATATDHGAAHRIVHNADHVYAVVGGMIRRLRPVALDELGLVAALEACVNSWRASQPNLDIRLHTKGDLDDLGESLNLAIYRIVQESLTNCVKHASARGVEVRLQRMPDPRGGDVAVLSIVDDGVGMALPQGMVEQVAEGWGLAGIRERVNMVDGELEVLSAQGAGVSIRAVFALQVRAR